MFDEPSGVAAHALMQDPAFAAALRRLGQHPLTLPCGLTLLSRRIAGMRILMLPRAVPPDDIAVQLRTLGMHRRPLLFSPPHPCKLPPSICLARPRRLAVLDISAPPEVARARLHQKWRNQLRRAERSGLCIVKTRPTPRRMEELTQREAAHSRKSGYANWPAPLTCALAAVAPSQAHLYQAKIGANVVAQMLFFSHGSAASYHIGLTTPEGRSSCAHNLLLWHAANDLAAHGCGSIDLGLLHDGAPGLTRFKLRTGARVCWTGGTFLRWRPFGAV